MEHEQMTYPEALRWLARKYNIEIQERELTPEEQAAQTAREGMLQVNDWARKTWENDLWNTEEGRNYGVTYFMGHRKLQEATIKRFHLGYSLKDKFEFYTRALSAGHKRDYILSTGLCYGDPGQRPVNRFRGRAIFPYLNLSGQVVAFGGRILDKVDHAAMKYVNSPESEIYRKSNMLYGIYEAKQSIAKRDKVFLVEGYFDVITMAQAGIENVVASSGTSLTSGQIQMIARFTHNITVLYDGDSAGIRASLRGIDMLLLEGMNVKVLLLPDGEDPDSFARSHSATELEEYIRQHEQDFIRFKTNLLMKDTENDPLKKSQVIQNILQSIALIPDSITSAVYIRETSQQVHLSEQQLTDYLNKLREKNYAAELRRQEAEQRRAEAQAALEAKRAEEGTSADSIPTEAPLSAESELPALNPEPARKTAVPNRITDQYERNLLRYIVRNGGQTFLLKYNDETGALQSEEWRVIDFIGNELISGDITYEFRHPVYARMFQMALDATEDQQKPFNGIAFFVNQPDPEISQTALKLADDRYEGLSFVDNIEDMSFLVPRAIMELKCAVVREQINQLQDALRQPGADFRTIMTEYNNLTALKKKFDKIIGERIVTN
jgi:DNA primase